MTGTGPVGVGVIGAGVISTQYLENLTTFPDLRVLFVADIDTDRAKAQADKFGIPGSGTVDELLADSEIEIVVNLTIPAAHVEVAARVIAAGKNAWTEKPFALDRESGAALLEQAQKLGLRVASAPDTFLGAGLQTGRRLIEGGAIGTPLSAIALFQVAGPESWHPNPDFYYAKGGGPLFDMAPYYLTALVQNLGPVTRVSAVGSRSSDHRVIGSGPRAGERIPVDVDTHFGALLQFEGGASAQCVFSFQSSVARQGFIEIEGTGGAVVFPDPNMFEGELVLHRAGIEPEAITATGVTSSRGTGVVELAQAIRADRPEAASGELGYHVLDVMVAIADAAASGTWVDVASTVVPNAPLPEHWDPRTATL
ncbi:MAG: Gfo/Idh/MocA family oxidoreductase [Rhodoglobus sp.]